MNAWNRDLVRQLYPRQRDDLLRAGPDGTVLVRVPERPPVMGQRIVSDDCDFGWVAAWTSELGDTASLAGLLRHADRYMQPTWEKGGLHYSRNDVVEDAAGNRTLVEPHTGNVLLGYARLNVPDGLWGLYNRPLEKAFFSDPALVEVGDGVSVRRAFVADGALVFDIEGAVGDEVTIGRIAALGAWSLRLEDNEVANGASLSIHKGCGWVRETSEGITVGCPTAGAHRFRFVTEPVPLR